MPLVRSGDADIYYEVTGEGDPLLLIMGLGADMQGWFSQIGPFSERYRVIAFENRGAGRSSTPPGPYTTEQMAADALAVMDAAGVERAHVVGVSLGGAIAQHVALAAPERVRSLVLAVTWAGPSRWRSRLHRAQLAIAKQGRDALVRARVLLVFSRTLVEGNPDLIDLIEKNMLEGGATFDGYLAQLEAAEAHDVRERLGSIDVPTLVLAARQDILVPPALTEEVAASIPGARLEHFDCAHAMPFEAAEAFNASVLGFLGLA